MIYIPFPLCATRPVVFQFHCITLTLNPNPVPGAGGGGGGGGDGGVGGCNGPGTVVVVHNLFVSQSLCIQL